MNKSRLVGAVCAGVFAFATQAMSADIAFYDGSVQSPAGAAKPRVVIAEQKRQLKPPPEIEVKTVVAKPVIIYPTPNAIIYKRGDPVKSPGGRTTRTVDLAVKANVIPGRRVNYHIAMPGRPSGIAPFPNRDGRFENLRVGEYCVYVRYEPDGPESKCVPFSVRLAVEPSRKRTGQ
ncbi:MAG: hypothetical protein WBN57_12390 [Gammaproteobacteria bacterium]|jgi:hypothetical protein